MSGNIYECILGTALCVVNSVVVLWQTLLQWEFDSHHPVLSLFEQKSGRFLSQFWELAVRPGKVILIFWVPAYPSVRWWCETPWPSRTHPTIQFFIKNSWKIKCECMDILTQEGSRKAQAAEWGKWAEMVFSSESSQQSLEPAPLMGDFMLTFQHKQSLD